MSNPEYSKMLDLWKSKNFNTDSVKWTNYYDYENIDSNYAIEKRLNNIKGDNSISTFVYVPFGVDFVLGNSSSTDSRNHIFVEGQFGLRFNDAFLGNSGVYFHRRYGLGYRFIF